MPSEKSSHPENEQETKEAGKKDLDYDPKPLSLSQNIVFTLKVLAGVAALVLLLWHLDGLVAR
ncbi:MAG: hypothetical protein DMG59_10055 [Acidobacteria bacterium]|jgi:hypothetical protein|nr:MAG: hypothetical protein DMG59_10055 [Acidobacteriota bacterium]